MAIDYVAYFATPELVTTTKELNWNDGYAVAQFFDQLEKQNLLKVWGQSTEGRSLNAVTDWLIAKCGLLNFGSELARELLRTCDYIHLVLPAKENQLVTSRIERLDPANDDTFDEYIEDFFTNLGVDFADEYLSQGMDHFYQLFEDLRHDLKNNPDKTLIVLLPY